MPNQLGSARSTRSQTGMSRRSRPRSKQACVMCLSFVSGVTQRETQKSESGMHMTLKVYSDRAYNARGGSCDEEAAVRLASGALVDRARRAGHLRRLGLGHDEYA